MVPHLVEDRQVKGLWDIPSVPHVEPIVAGRRCRRCHVPVERRGRIDRALTVEDACRAFKDSLKLLQGVGRDVERELSVDGADKAGIDAQSLVISREGLLLVVVEAHRPCGLPLGHFGQERDILAREITKSCEFLQRLRAPAKDVLEGRAGGCTFVN